MSKIREEYSRVGEDVSSFVPVWIEDFILGETGNGVPLVYILALVMRDGSHASASPLNR